MLGDSVFTTGQVYWLKPTVATDRRGRWAITHFRGDVRLQTKRRDPPGTASVNANQSIELNREPVIYRKFLLPMNATRKSPRWLILFWLCLPPAALTIDQDNQLKGLG